MHIRCPHCHSPIEVVDSDPLIDIACPSCGSNFNLNCGETASYTPGSVRTIGHFELLESVGGGHFGTVWKARDTKLDRTVAIKIPRKGQIEGNEAEMFIREARAAAQVKHPGVVAIHEVGRENGTVYIASDFVDGCNLKEWLSARQISPKEAAELCMKIAEALDAAHEAGVVHRDLKPGNVMMDMAGEPHLTDFGLAKREMGEITVTVDGQVLGTPAYMSPEQARGEAHKADRRSDVYSLGVILFELLTGELPFRGNQRMMVVQILQDEPPSPRKLQARIPRDMETICLKCLEKDPGKRYQTSGDVAKDLQRQLRGEPIHARPASRTDRFWRWCKREPVVAGLMVAIAITLAAGTLVSSFFAANAYHQAKLAQNSESQAQNEKIRASQKAVEADRNAELAIQKADEAKQEKNRAEAQLALTHAAQYSLQINLAQRNLLENDITGAEKLLDGCALDFPGWEHRYLWTNIRKRRMLINANTDSVSCVALSTDGQRIVTGCADATVRIWDAGSGQELLALRGHTDLVSCVAFSPDDLRLVSGSWDKTVKIWDARSGQDLLTLKGHEGAVSCVAFSPDGQRIVSGSQDKTLKVWDSTSGQDMLTLEGHTDGASSVAFSPDNQRIVSGSYDKTVKTWDARSGQGLLTLTGHTEGVSCVAFSPDNQRIVSGSYCRTVKIWDAQSGQELLKFKGYPYWLSSVAVSPDGQRIVSGGWDKTVTIWDAGSGQDLLTFKGHTDVVSCVAFSSDGQRVVSGSADKTVMVWRVANGQETVTLKGHKDPVLSVAISPDSRQLVSGGWDTTVKIWDAESGQELLTLKGHANVVCSVAFSPDGQRIISGSYDRTVKIWDARSGQDLLTLTGHTEGVSCVAFSPDNQRIISGSYDKTVKIWDARSGQGLLTLKGHTEPVLSVIISSDAKRIVSGSGDSTVRIWDVASGQELLALKGHTDTVFCVAFSPDGRRLVSGSADSTLKLWDSESDEKLRYAQKEKIAVRSEAFPRLEYGHDQKLLTPPGWDTNQAKDTPRYGNGVIQAGNVALVTNGTQVEGVAANADKLLDGDAKNPPRDRDAAISPVPCEWTFTFDKVYLLRQIRFHFYDGDVRYYQYAMAVSADGMHYKPLVNHGSGQSFSWQDIPLNGMPVKSVKIYGTFSYRNKPFSVTEFEAYCVPPKP